MDKNKIKSEKIALIVVIILFSGILSYGLIISKPTPTPVSVPDCPPTVTDIDGNVYNTVIIGSQCWMKENLKVTKDPQGKDITRYCYDNDPKICETDGGLYDWNTAMNGSTQEGAQGICPDGWHVPTDLEWYTLEDELATDNCISELKYTLWPVDYRCDPAGAKLGKGGESGFDGVWGGSYQYQIRTGKVMSDGTRGLLGYYWTSTDKSYRLLNASNTKVARWHAFDKNDINYSLRCLKD